MVDTDADAELEEARLEVALEILFDAPGDPVGAVFVELETLLIVLLDVVTNVFVGTTTPVLEPDLLELEAPLVAPLGNVAREFVVGSVPPTFEELEALPVALVGTVASVFVGRTAVPEELLVALVGTVAIVFVGRTPVADEVLLEGPGREAMVVGG